MNTCHSSSTRWSTTTPTPALRSGGGLALSAGRRLVQAEAPSGVRGAGAETKEGVIRASWAAAFLRSAHILRIRSALHSAIASRRAGIRLKHAQHFQRSNSHVWFMARSFEPSAEAFCRGSGSVFGPNRYVGSPELALLDSMHRLARCREAGKGLLTGGFRSASPSGATAPLPIRLES
jgi:hypothetical protein